MFSSLAKSSSSCSSSPSWVSPTSEFTVLSATAADESDEASASELAEDSDDDSEEAWSPHPRSSRPPRPLKRSRRGCASSSVRSALAPNKRQRRNTATGAPPAVDSRDPSARSSPSRSPSPGALTPSPNAPRTRSAASSSFSSPSPLLPCKSNLSGCTQLPDKTYLCTCGRGPFLTLGGLRAHAKLHGVGKPHSCAECGLAFQRKQDLKRHELTHAGFKPYMCVCGGGFSRSDALHRHVRTYGCKRGL
ncbi:hypothetical protein DFJ73DRAFT_626873 [Zopfochytrium polystomum]|nr:hypothetical protein DFJ73DRAFT_626873 [Zopfochytrium polystomum]